LYRKQIRRRRAVFIGLVAFAFVMLTVTFGSGSGGVGSTFGAVFGPIQNVASDALKPARDLINWFDDTFEAKGERERLERDLAKARSEAVAGKAAVEQNRQLRKLVGLKSSGRIPSGYRPVTASVVSRSPTMWLSTVGIDRGTADGIEVDDPVVSADGLVGTISAASANEATVTLITDGASAVSVKIVPSGAQGVLRPRIGSAGDLVIEFLDETSGIGQDQSVVTAGWREDDLASLYPPNLPIGEVRDAPLDEREAIQSVSVRAYPDFRNLDLVQVLTGGSRG